ncbi:MAG: flippase-like domain-containing protein [Spirochaetota bacterium]
MKGISSRRSLNRILRYAIIIIVALGLILAFVNYKRLREFIQGISIVYLIYTIGSSLLVYTLEGLFLYTSLKVFGERLPVITSIRYSFIINSVGYFVSLGGLTPFATQVYVLDHHNIQTRKAALSRILQVILFNFMFSILFITGVIMILIEREIMAFSLKLILGIVIVFFILFSILYLAIFWRAFRLISVRVGFTFINRLLRLFNKNFHINPMKAVEFLDDFSKGFTTLLKKPGYLIPIILITLVDWVLWLSVMYLSFLAFNYRIEISALIIGFSIGQVVAIVSMVPGGLGTMEGSMALTFAALNVPFNTAIGAILFYRFSFHIIPFFLSLPLYFILKRRIQN